MTKLTTSTSTQIAPLTQSALGILLVLIEAMLALVLRLDASLRRAAYPLVQTDCLVCVRTYLPHAQVYVSFTPKGILLDTTPPKNRTPDITVNAYSHELFLAVLGNNSERIDALQMRGEKQQIAQLRTFLLTLGMGGIANTLLKKFRQNPNAAEETATKKQNEFAALKEELTQKDRQLQTIQSDNKRLSTELAELQGKHNATKIALILMSVVAIVAIIANFVW